MNLSLLLNDFVFGNENFGLSLGRSPALHIFGFEIYLYAICIVTGMCLAILFGALYFKKRGYDPYDITEYALVVIPLGVLGARAYIYIFPWAGSVPNWSTFFDFRGGGLGIYGGVIVGYLAAMVLAKIKGHRFGIVTDCVMPGVMLAQSIGRWGNYFNQEAYGELITTVYDALPHSQSGLFSNFNGLAVWIQYPSIGQPQGWYQATFFYESFCNFIGFLLCVFVLTRSKRYKIGWCTAFYGIYYGIVRLVIEGMRTDSLYLYIGNMQTDIKISQLVSIFTICLGIITLSNVYRKDIHKLYKKFFTSDLHELRVSRWLLIVLSAVLLALGILFFALGGESNFILAVALTVLAIYSGLGAWSIFDRLQLYDDQGNLTVNPDNWQTDKQKHYTATICYSVVMAVVFVFGLFSLLKWGIMDGVANGIVLFVICTGLCVAMVIFKYIPTLKLLNNATDKGNSTKLNKFLLFVFPPKAYQDYGVEHLTPWVDPDKDKKKSKK